LSEAQLRTMAQTYSLCHRPDRSPNEAPILAEASGSVVRDVTGKEYLDFNAGEMCAALGHNNPRIMAAIAEAGRTISNASNTFYTVAEIKLAAKIGEMSPPPLRKSVFHSSGCESIEAAMGMAKKSTGGYEIMSPHASYHGLSEAPRSVTHAGWRNKVGPFAPGAHAMFAPYCYRCPLQKTFPSCELACVDASFELFDASSTGHQAAVITEPLFSAGGVIDPPAGWLRKVEERCDERGMLLILDEAQTGLAKLGRTYAFTAEEGVTPDIVAISKHFGGGIAISAVVTSEAIETRLRETGYQINHSHDADPLACRAALESLHIIEDEHLNEKAGRIGDYWRKHLLKLQDEFAFIGDVRGRGTIHGIELVKNPVTREPHFEAGAQVLRASIHDGLYFTLRRRGSVLRFVPPFTTTEEQMDRAAEILWDALSGIPC
ncbi:MAG: aspartate aminotransferase family protein, partial [Vulcanimicrobiaceae bacterium]